jgi:replication initiation and membrane attachment protein DnaB
MGRMEDSIMHETANFIIGYFEKVTPEQMLSYASGGKTISADDFAIIKFLRKESRFSDPVINVLLQYVLVKNHRMLDKELILNIAARWEDTRVNTAREALCLLDENTKFALLKHYGLHTY